MSSNESESPSDAKGLEGSPGAAAGRPAEGSSTTPRAAASAIAGALRDGLSSAAQRGGPVVRKAAAGFSAWLVSISWWKFLLLATLLLASIGILSSLLGSKTKSSWAPDQGDIDVQVHVVPLPDGSLQIQSAEGDHPKSIVIHPRAGGGKAGEPKRDDGVLLQIEGEDKDHPAVRVDRQGVRILADKDEGGKASVIIDRNGVRIENVPAKGGQEGASPGALDGAHAHEAATPPGAKVPDPEEVADAVEAARDGIESVLQDQVDRKLLAYQIQDHSERGSRLEGLAVLFIVVSIIVKIALGSKTRAESRARQASEVAAQEGLRRQLAEAQVKMMQAQVEPHFLFNTLASVDYLIETDPARASRMQKHLIQYLRAALPQMREGASTLGRELLQCRSYLEILKVRMDERLHFSINVPQALQAAEFPPMMLLTLVENAIKHGLEPKPEGGNLSVSATVSERCLQVAVADSGMGFGVAARGGTGVGLANVRERLQALYGAAARLQIEANADGGTIATIVVPYRVHPAGAAQTAAATAGNDAGLAAAPGGAS